MAHTVGTFTVVKGKVLRQADQRFSHHAIAFEVHILVLGAAPEPLDKNVVNRSSSAGPC